MAAVMEMPQFVVNPFTQRLIKKGGKVFRKINRAHPALTFGVPVNPDPLAFSRSDHDTQRLPASKKTRVVQQEEKTPGEPADPVSLPKPILKRAQAISPEPDVPPPVPEPEPVPEPGAEGAQDVMSDDDDEPVLDLKHYGAQIMKDHAYEVEQAYHDPKVNFMQYLTQLMHDYTYD